MPETPFRVIIAGGGVAGLEALLALRSMAAERVELTVVAPQDAFVYRPLAVAEPFALGRARRTPLSASARDAGATLVIAGVQSVDPDARAVTTSDEQTLEYDALLLAVGAQASPAIAHALTWDDRCDIETLGGLLQDIEQGYSRRLAVVIPPGPGWPLPAYELALLITRQAYGMGMDLHTTLITPEHAPLAVFGPRAVETVTEELEAAGVAIETSAYAHVEHNHKPTVVMRPSERRLEVDRVVALPALHGRHIEGVPADDDGFVDVDEHCRVRGLDGVWGAGDGIAFPVKFGGLAAQQADAAAADIAQRAGALVEARPFRPVLRGRLLTGHGQRWLRYDAAGAAGEGEVSPHALWWAPGKVAGRYLAPWLAARDDEAVASHLPHAGGMPVLADLHRSFVGS